MAKKAQAKAAAPKARPKTPAPKKAAAPARSSAPVAVRPAGSKYDQPGAPWWKKFRSSASAVNR